MKNIADKDQIEHIEKYRDYNFEQKIRDAIDIAHGMSLKEGLKRYPKVIGWSLIISTVLISEAYDSSLLVGAKFYIPWLFFRKKK